MEIVSNWKVITRKIIVSIVCSIVLIGLMAWKYHIISNVNRIIIYIVLAFNIVLIAYSPTISNKDNDEKYFQRVDLLDLMIVASLCLQLFFSFGFYKGTVTGNSMHPTLVNGEDVIVRSTKKVEKGDIVILYVDKDINELAFGVNDDELLIKRVIGTSGDIVYAKNGIVYINGEVEDWGKTLAYTNDFDLAKIIKNNVDLDGEILVIPEGYILVLGDNRGSSNDSRYLGLFKESQILGKTLYKRGKSIFDWSKIE